MVDEKMSFCSCFSGHRDLPADRQLEIKRVLENVIDKLIEGGCNRFISGGALGFDQLAAQLVIEKKRVFPHIRLIMALPCKDQHKKWAVSDQRRYEKILESADEVVFLCEKYCTGCMQLRNKYMVDNSQVCVAFCTSRSGGTAQTIQYAQDVGKDVVNIRDYIL